MPIASSDILRVVAKMTNNYGAEIQNVYHIRCTVSSDPGDATVVDEIAEWMDDAYGQLDAAMPNNITFDTVQVWNESTDTFLGETGFPTITAGQQAAAGLPNQTSPLALFNTNVNRSQGRKFLPPFTEGNLDDDGSPDLTAIAVIGYYIATILAGISGTGWSGAPGNWNVNLSRFVPWVWGVARNIYATQRRRYLGSGA